MMKQIAPNAKQRKNPVILSFLLCIYKVNVTMRHNAEIAVSAGILPNCSRRPCPYSIACSRHPQLRTQHQP